MTAVPAQSECRLGHGGWSLAGVVALAAVLRCVGLTAESLWYDEAYSVWSSAMDIASPRLLWEWRIEFPLYYWLLHYWMRLFGDGEWAVRAFGAVAGVASVVPLYYLARGLFDHRVGVLAAALLALNPYHVWYSQEVRMYSWALLCVLVSLYAFWHVMRSQEMPVHWGWWLLYVATTGMTFHLHYYVGWLVLAENVFVLVFMLLRERDDGVPTKWVLRRWALAQIGIVLLALPAVAVFYHKLVVLNQWDWLGQRYGPPRVRQVATLFLSYSVGTLLPGPSVLAWGALGLLGGLAILGALIHVWRACRRQDSRAPITFVLLGLVLPLGACFALGQFYSVWVERYMILFMPFFLILVALGVRAVPMPALRCVAIVGLVAVSAYALFAMYTTPQKEDWRGVSAYLEPRVGAQDVVVLMDAECRVPFDYYYHGDGTRVEVSRFAKDGEIAVAVDEISRLCAKNLWVIVSHADGAALIQQLDALPTLSRVESPGYVGIELVAYTCQS